MIDSSAFEQLLPVLQKSADSTQVTGVHKLMKMVARTMAHIHQLLFCLTLEASADIDRKVWRIGL